MARGRAKLEWDQTALLWSLTANVNRDPKEQPRPYLPSEVHPFRTAEDYGLEENDGPDLAAIAQIKRNYKVTRLKSNGKSLNRGRESISPADSR